MKMSENPYAPPSATGGPPDLESPERERLASRWTRCLASVIDAFLMALCVYPIQALTGYTQRAARQELALTEQLGMTTLGIAVYLALNGHMLLSRGQSIGKRLTGIQIVDHETAKLLPLMRVYVYRYLWLLPFQLIAFLIPGVTDDIMVSGIVLIDALAIFGPERRCLHDRIAGTKVVMYQDGRGRIDAFAT